MNKILESFLNKIPDTEADELLVDEAYKAMIFKLADSRSKGKRGWHTSEASTDSLMESLVSELSSETPDMVDVMNYAAMIYVRKEIYGTDK